jgi:MFS family permease
VHPDPRSKVFPFLSSLPFAGLGLTQIIGYGSLYYAFAVIEPQIARDLGISSTWTFGCFSFALLVGGIAAPWAGRLIDRYGARTTMGAGSVAAAFSLLLLSQADSAFSLAAALVVLEIASTLVLYDAAFAAVSQMTAGRNARRSITLITLFGGFASTAFWPLTQFLLGIMSWREVYALYAALHLLAAAPLHLLALRHKLPAAAPSEMPQAESEGELLPHARARAMVLLVSAFCLTGFVFSALNVHWVSALGALGISASMAVAAGSLMGPAQVAVRLLEIVTAHRIHPLHTACLASAFLLAALACLMLTGTNAFLFAILFGLSQGLTSIIRGVVPLALFGKAGYGSRLGKITAIRVIVTAAAPLAFAAAMDLAGIDVTLMLAATLTALSIAALLAIPRRQVQPATA